MFECSAKRLVNTSSVIVTVESFTEHSLRNRVVAFLS
jgi:hypothetical protein